MPMKLLSIYALLSLALSATANPLAERQDAPSCISPTVVSSRTAQVGENVVLLEVLACPTGLATNPVPTPATNALVLAADSAVSPVEYGLGNVLCDLLPFIFCPPRPCTSSKPAPPKTTTATKTTTVVKTTTTTKTDTTTKTIVTTITSVVTPTPTPTPTPVDVCGEICDVSCSELGQLPPNATDCAVIVDSIQIFEGNSSPTFVVEPLHIQQLTFGTCRFFFENLGMTELEYCWQDLANQGSLAATTCFPPTQPVMSLGICQATDTTWEVGVSHS